MTSLYLEPAVKITHEDLQTTFITMFHYSINFLRDVTDDLLLGLENFVISQYRMLRDIAVRVNKVEYCLHAELFGEYGHYNVIFRPKVYFKFSIINN